MSKNMQFRYFKCKHSRKTINAKKNPRKDRENRETTQNLIATKMTSKIKRKGA
jgi:hypothetical protein